MTKRDDYLWDRTGEPDPDVQTLERALAPLAESGRPLELPAAGAITTPSERPAWREPRVWLAAACLLVVAGLALWTSSRPRGPAWRVARVEGEPRIGFWRFGDRAELGEGQTLVTDERSRARVDVGAIGNVTLEPGSRLRLVRARDAEHRMALDRGALMAYISAPPRWFTVETPAANAVDLGCSYRLEVGRDGRSIVSVQTGWVSFERGGREAFVPAGARCVTLKGHDPGVPHFEDAPPQLVAGLATLNEAPFGHRGRGALEAVLAHARREDALTLWHLLARMNGESRERVYARLAALAPPPAGVTRAAVLAGQREALDRYWNSLGLGDIEGWRLWAQDPPAGADRR